MTRLSSDSIVAVPGGAGYLGSILCANLLDSGYRVRVLDRCFFGAEALAACLEHGDRFELRRVDSRDVGAEQFEGVEAVIDLAGLSNDPSCMLDDGLTEAINIDGGRRLVQAAKAAGVRRYVYQSSCSVYGSGGDTFVNEDSELAPVSAYAESKLAMEEVVQAEAGDGFEVTMSRMGTLFGLSRRMRFDLIINIMTLSALRDGRIFVLGGGAQWRPLLHVSDAARGLRLLAEAEGERVAGRIFNVGSTELNFRVIRVARIIAEVVDQAELIVVPSDPDRRSYRIDFLRFEEEFDFSPQVTPRRGAEEIYDALRREEVDTGLKTKTVDYYRYLLEAKQVLDEIMLDGRLL